MITISVRIVVVLLAVVAYAKCGFGNTLERGKVIVRGSLEVAVLDLSTRKTKSMIRSDIGETSVSGNLVLVVSRNPDTGDPGLNLWDLRKDSVEMLSVGENFRTAAISRDGSFIALADCLDKCNVRVVDRSEPSKSRYILKGANQVRRLTWSAVGNFVAIEFGNDTFSIVNASSAALAVDASAGAGVGWSPHELKVAIFREQDREMGIFDLNTKEYQEVLSRRFWESRLIGAASWSPDGRFILFNTPAGADGYKISCDVIEVRTSQVTNLQIGDKFCGPWQVDKI